MGAEGNGTQPEMMQVEIPEYMFEIKNDAEGKPWCVTLKLITTGTAYESFLCRAAPADVELVARAFNRELLRVSTALKRTGKGLIVAKGVDSSVLRAERRQEGR